MRRSSFIELSDSAVRANKTFVVPSDVYYEILFAHAVLSTSGSAGTRVIQLGIEDESNNSTIDVHSGVSDVFGQTNRHHTFMQGMFRETSYTNGTAQTSIPKDFFVPPGYTIRIKEGSEVDLSGDTIDVTLVVEKYPN